MTKYKQSGQDHVDELRLIQTRYFSGSIDTKKYFRLLTELLEAYHATIDNTEFNKLIEFKKNYQEV